MIVKVVSIFIKPEFVEDFITATIENHKNSVQESGNIRFDVVQCSTDPTRFLLYEVYESEEASEAHRQSAHFAKWLDTVTDMMTKPREGIQYNVIAPTEREAW